MRLLLGTSKIADYNLLGSIIPLMNVVNKKDNTFICGSGSAILAACLGIGMNTSDIINFYDCLSPIVKGFEWNKETVKLLVNSEHTYKLFDLRKLLIAQFGHITLKEYKDTYDNSLEILAYNINTDKIGVFSADTEPDCKLVEALTLSVNLPGYFTVGLHKGSVYVDITVFDRFPNKTFDYDIGIYLVEKYHSITDAILNASCGRIASTDKDIGIRKTSGAPSDQLFQAHQQLTKDLEDKL